MKRGVTWRPGPTGLTRTALILALVLRGLLVVVNEEANDDHSGVIQVLAYEGRIPANDELWEAFQPKLYHVTVAGVLQALPRLSRPGVYRVAQLVSAVAGALTVLIVYRFLGRLGWPGDVRAVTGALVALSPDLMAASGQATNDAFVILFASVTAWAGWRFFQAPALRPFLLVTAAAILAGLAKGNGLVVSVALLGTLAAAILRPPPQEWLSRRRALACLGAAGLALALAVPGPGSYLESYRHPGFPGQLFEPTAPPPWLTPTYVRRPGVTDVASGYFTFRLIGMLQDPIIFQGPQGYPLHRTSVWSQLYGRAHSGHFAAWPPSWASRREYVKWLVRVELLLGLAPTIVLAVGLARAAVGVLGWLRPGHLAGLALPGLFLALVALGYLAFVLAYAYRLRDFSAMKSLFVAPGVLAFAAIFGTQLASCSRSARKVTVLLSSALAGVYAADAALIVARLIKGLVG